MIIVAHTKFPVEVLTPEGEVFNEEVEMLSTHTALGSIGILANHEPVLALLEPTELRLYRSESEIVRFAQAEGYLQFTENRALVLVEEAIAPDQLDRATLETRLRDARSSLEQAQEGSERQARARRDIRRYEAFLAVGQ
ncbi:MAG: ATP synthase F1 subunit epsilon [Actinobacteria bacterium]|nr:MAG: ATP synthase F1 subunit epsilon [Actinomycetota bacterium]